MPAAARRALLVAPTVELAAGLAEPFEDALVVTTTAEFDDAWAAAQHRLDVVAVTSLGAAALSHVAAAVRAGTGGDGATTLLVDLGALPATDRVALAGYDADGVTQLAGVAYINLRPVPESSTLPVLPGAGEEAGGAQRAGALDTFLATREAFRRVERHGSVATASSAASPAASPSRASPASGAPRAGRSSRQVGWAVAVLVLAVGGCVALALLTGTGYVGTLAGVLVLLGVANLLYVWRSNRWRATVDARLAKAVADQARRSEDSDGSVRRIAARQDELEHIGRDILLGLRVFAAGGPGPAPRPGDEGSAV